MKKRSDRSRAFLRSCPGFRSPRPRSSPGRLGCDPLALGRSKAFSPRPAARACDPLPVGLDGSPNLFADDRFHAENCYILRSKYARIRTLLLHLAKQGEIIATLF